jgi:hypothetical protein
VDDTTLCIRLRALPLGVLSRGLKLEAFPKTARIFNAWRQTLPGGLAKKTFAVMSILQPAVRPTHSRQL